MSTMSGGTIPPLLSSHAGAVANLTTALSAQVENTLGQGLMQQSALRLDVPPGPC